MLPFLQALFNTVYNKYWKHGIDCMRNNEHENQEYEVL